MLRPETIESLFIAYRLTGDQRYRDHGWRIFQAIEKHCRVEGGGYATIINVDENPSRQEDKMETFFLVRQLLWWCRARSSGLNTDFQSETLKYLYLLFDNSDVIPLDREFCFLRIRKIGANLICVPLAGYVLNTEVCESKYFSERNTTDDRRHTHSRFSLPIYGRASRRYCGRTLAFGIDNRLAGKEPGCNE